MDNRPDAMAGENIGWRMETIVYIELCRRSRTEGTDIYYYKKHSRAKEVDFVVCRGNKILRMYQVAYSLTNDKTRLREIDSLVQASNDTKCRELYLITDFERETVEKDGCRIEIIPAYEWLLSYSADSTKMP